MRSAPTRSWRGVSAEQRHAARRGQLVDAALEVIGSRGWARTGVRDVCREAGLTERYFYESFPDREALLLAVFEHVVEICTDAVLVAFAAAPDGTRAKVRAAIAAAFVAVTEDPRLGRVLFLESGSDERLQRRRQEVAVSSASLLAGIVVGHFARPVDPLDLELSTLALVGAQTQLATAYLAGHLDVSRERMIEHLVELHLASVSVTSTAVMAAAGPVSRD
jgi:AcrR family transcriptional regulator